MTTEGFEDVPRSHGGGAGVGACIRGTDRIRLSLEDQGRKACLGKRLKLEKQLDGWAETFPRDYGLFTG